MTMQRTKPKYSLARNLRFLMDNYPGGKLSEQRLAKMAGVAQKTINNILNPDRQEVGAPNLDTVDKLAAVFDLTLWHLIIPDLPEELIKNKSLENLYKSYANASKEGRELIEKIADREAQHSVKK